MGIKISHMDGETAELGELSKMMLSNYVVDGQISLMEAMHVIDKNAKGIVYVAENLFLRGVITDGDIRRFLIEGGKLNECVSNIANRNPYSVLMGHEEEVPALMKQHCISSVPVLDDSGRIVRIYFSDDKIEQKKEKLNIPVVIMAGGKGYSPLSIYRDITKAAYADWRSNDHRTYYGFF